MRALIVCDLDGTLIDSREDLANAVNLARKDFNLPPLALETVVKFVGDGTRNLMTRALADSPGADIAAAVQSLKRHYGEHLRVKTTLYPGVASGLRRLRAADFAIALVSNKPTAFCERLMAEFELAPLFAMISGGDAGYALKPDPAALLAALEKVQTTVDRAWIVGDHYADLEAGRRAGFKRCYAAYGFGDPKNESYDLKVDSFGEFADILLAEK